MIQPFQLEHSAASQPETVADSVQSAPLNVGCERVCVSKDAPHNGLVKALLPYCMAAMYHINTYYNDYIISCDLHHLINRSHICVHVCSCSVDTAFLPLVPFTLNLHHLFPPFPKLKPYHLLQGWTPSPTQ